MHDLIAFAAGQVRRLIDDAFVSAASAGALPIAGLPSYMVEIPAETEHGDFAANIAMASARALKMPSRAVADAVVAHIEPNELFREVQVAGPGFINFFLSDRFFDDALKLIFDLGADYGRTDAGAGQKSLVEFVSANPTGPMHLGNARGGALGDSLAALLDACGYTVEREFYVNDAGNQIARFAASLEARYLALFQENVEFPEDGYQGEDIAEHARDFAAEFADSFVAVPSERRREALVAYALPKNIDAMKAALHAYRIDYDNWFLESSLHADGAVRRVMDTLAANGHTYEKDGALWYRATDFGGEKDEVLMRSNGFYTYFAADIAYHHNKLVTRGFDLAIDIWGADHHGHVARLKGAMQALGIDSARLEVVLTQMVNLVRDGQPVRMSKRTGKMITLLTLLDEIPIDAARFYFILREYSSHFDFDLDLAIKKSNDNPVYYVQYAHARICSILNGLAAEGLAEDYENGDFSLLMDPDERALIRRLALLPGEIAAAAREREPARMTRYAVDLATAFHRFYTNCRVKVEDAALCSARAALCAATRQTLRNCLGLLKINAPESM